MLYLCLDVRPLPSDKRKGQTVAVDDDDALAGDADPPRGRVRLGEDEGSERQP